jgi:hypothetical protein
MLANEPAITFGNCGYKKRMPIHTREFGLLHCKGMIF